MTSSRLEKIIRSTETNYHFSRPSIEIIQRYLEKTAAQIVKEIEKTAETNNYGKKIIQITLTRDICEKFLVSPTDEVPSTDISLLKEEPHEIGEMKHETDNLEVA